MLEDTSKKLIERYNNSIIHSGIINTNTLEYITLMLLIEEFLNSELSLWVDEADSVDIYNKLIEIADSSCNLNYLDLSNMSYNKSQDIIVTSLNRRYTNKHCTRLTSEGAVRKH